MQINIEKIKSLVKNSSKVVIMAHKRLDLDALGSSLGLYYFVKSLGKKATLLIEEDTFEDGVGLSLLKIKKNKIDIDIKKYSQLDLDSETLLIIIDTNNMSLVQNELAVKNIKNKILIDHHINSGLHDKKFLYTFICNEQSSSVEIVIEMLKYLDIYIPPYIATIMLSGIYVDSNRFSSKVSYKTHEGAAYLYKCGALSDELVYLLKEDFDEYVDQLEVVSKAERYNNCLIALGNENKCYKTEDLAKIAEKLILIKDIEVAFTIGKINDQIIGISARSIGKINVQQIMKKMGGGGHNNEAAVQIKDLKAFEVLEKLKKIVGVKK